MPGATRPLMVVLGFLFSVELLAQDYPAKAVTFIVPLAPGGGVDAVIRMVTPKLSQAWSQDVAVDNRVGDGGTVGTAIVAKAPSDGYTLLATSSAHVASSALRTHLPYDPLRSFIAVAPLTSQGYVLVVGKDAGFKSIKELIAAAKSRPGELKFTSAGLGSGTHLMAEKFHLDAGIRMMHIPTAGAGAANDEVIAGRITYWFSSATPALKHIKEGRLLALGVSASRRLHNLPDVPTVAEAGVAGFNATLWYGVWAPAGTSAAIAQKINSDIGAALASSDVAERVAKSGAEALKMTPEEFTRFVQAEAADAARIVSAAGITPAPASAR